MVLTSEASIKYREKNPYCLECLSLGILLILLKFHCCLCQTSLELKALPFMFSVLSFIIYVLKFMKIYRCFGLNNSLDNGINLQIRIRPDL